MADVQKELKHITESAGPSAQVIVALFGSIVIGEGRTPFPGWFSKGRQVPHSGELDPLDEIVTELAAGAGKDKLLLVDLALPKGMTLESVLSLLKSPHPGTEVLATTAPAGPGGKSSLPVCSPKPSPERRTQTGTSVSQRTSS